MDHQAFAQLLGNYGEFLGSIAILITLGYLTVQVRQARSETRRTLSQGRLEGNRRVIELEMDEANLGLRVKANVAFGQEPSPVLAEIMEKAGMTYEEAYRVFMVEIASWNYRVTTMSHIEELPPREKELFDGAMYTRYSRGVSRFIYETHLRPLAHPEIVEYIDSVLGQPRQFPRPADNV